MGKTTLNLAAANSNNLLVTGNAAATGGKDKQDVGVKSPSEDKWLGVASQPSNCIEGTPYFLSRAGMATPSDNQGQRLNAKGYDMDDPKDAIAKYEAEHPKSWGDKICDFFSDVVFNVCTLGVPKALQLSAGDQKQRIDQKVILNIVRESVDRFPELKIRVKSELLDTLSPADQRRFYEMMAVIRTAQHDFIADELAKVYPNHINRDAPTILFTGGRGVGYLRVLYCSMDEYVADFWTESDLVSTDSGAYRAHVYDYVSEGHNKNWNARYLDDPLHNFEVTEPGEYTFLGENDRKIWSFIGPVAMIDQGIGDIASMLKFATISNATSTLNWHAIATLLSAQGAAVAHEYWQRFKEFLGVTEVDVAKVSRVTPEQLAEARVYFAEIMLCA